jgi:ABC-type transporter Mla MlaB component
VYPTEHNFLRNLFLLAAITTLTGTTVETIVTMWLFGNLWQRWTLAFKITTPMLHILFMSAQLWRTWCFYKLYQKQTHMLVKKAIVAVELEAGVKKVDSGGVSPAVVENEQKLWSVIKFSDPPAS